MEVKMKTLIVYYSAEDHTKKIAEEIAKNLGADLFEIVPSPIYTPEDLDWTNPDSRSSRENDNPELQENIKLETSTPKNWSEYERIILGYPIWWGISAWPMSIFVKQNDWTNKTIIPFCTSHSSGIGDSDLLLKDVSNGGNWQDGTRFFQDTTSTKIKEWTDSLN